VSEQTQAHEATCPECGAPRVSDMTCWKMLGALLAREYDDPELRAEHFLTVACYNLQQPAQLSEATLAGLRAVLVERLDHGLEIAEIRRVGKAAAGAARVLKRETERQPILRQWAMTIADVCLPDQPQAAAERVRAWAAVIRREIASV
jgi:hypothetical protein